MNKNKCSTEVSFTKGQKITLQLRNNVLTIPCTTQSNRPAPFKKMQFRWQKNNETGLQWLHPLFPASVKNKCVRFPSDKALYLAKYLHNNCQVWLKFGQS